MAKGNRGHRQKDGKRERTRATLIAATLKVVASKGFSGASLDEISAVAGMTKGAIYSNFSGKAELLKAAMSAKGLKLGRTHPPGTSLRTHLESMARDLAGLLRRARGDARLVAEFQLYALGDPELRGAVATGYATAFASGAEHLSRMKDLKSSMPARHLAVALQSIALGFLFQSFATPDEVSEDTIFLTMKALADGITARRSPPRSRPVKRPTAAT